MIAFNYQHLLGSFKLDANAEFPSSGITVLFGESGCGKSSLLRLMAGFVKSSSGLLNIGQKRLQTNQSSVDIWSRSIGYITQSETLFPHLRVVENLEYAQKRATGKIKLWQFKDLIKSFKIQHLLTKYPNELSGGEAQRVSMVRTLLSQPRLILMDEPVSALDEDSRFELLKILKQLITENNQTALLYITHDRREVAIMADYLLVMNKGVIINSGPYQILATDIQLTFAHGNDSISVLPVTVGDQSDEVLTELLFGDVSLWARTTHCVKQKIGLQVRVQIPSNEVSLSLNRVEYSSILNQFPVMITGIGGELSGQQLISLDAKGHQLLARITRRSVEHLDLEIGTHCFASFKAVAINL